MSYRSKVFLILTTIMVVMVLVWAFVRDRSYADERDAWGVVIDSLSAQQARIDSLDALLARLDASVTEGKRELGSSQQRIAHYERRAEQGSLASPQHREYERTVGAHNQVVTRYNATVTELERVYGEYSQLIDAHNVLVDSANAMQRRATQEGYALPNAGVLRE